MTLALTAWLTGEWAGETNALGGNSGLWTPVFGGTFPLISRTPKQIHAKSIRQSTDPQQHFSTILLPY